MYWGSATAEVKEWHEGDQQGEWNEGEQQDQWQDGEQYEELPADAGSGSGGYFGGLFGGASATDAPPTASPPVEQPAHDDDEEEQGGGLWHGFFGGYGADWDELRLRMKKANEWILPPLPPVAAQLPQRQEVKPINFDGSWASQLRTAVKGTKAVATRPAVILGVTAGSAVAGAGAGTAGAASDAESEESISGKPKRRISAKEAHRTLAFTEPVVAQEWKKSLRRPLEPQPAEVDTVEVLAVPRLSEPRVPVFADDTEHTELMLEQPVDMSDPRTMDALRDEALRRVTQDLRRGAAQPVRRTVMPNGSPSGSRLPGNTGSEVAGAARPPGWGASQKAGGRLVETWL